MTGERSAMSDASSERLAPVTYLPWVREASAPRPSAAPAERLETSVPAVSAPPPQISPVPIPTDVEVEAELQPDRRREAAPRRSKRGDTPRDDAVDEIGAERDERIDRLVVSRLRRSALSVAEVRAVLVEHGLDEVEVGEWIERYERYGYLDDARLGEQLVQSHGARRGRGSGAILQELGRRGIDSGLARGLVNELDPEAELENARAVAERRARQLTGLDRQTAQRRLSAFLARRGYPGDVVRQAVAAALAADGS